jgi:large subunit ribosomal protein L10
MPTQEKIEKVAELKEILDKATCLISTNYSQMTGNTAVQLRNTLREQEIKFVVVKNRLAYIAADEIGKPEIKEITKGQSGLAISFGDPVNAAKAINNFIESEQTTISITGGVLDGKILTPEEVVSLAKLPGRNELIAQLLGQLQNPAVGFVRVINAPITGLATVLQRRIESLEQNND